MPNKHCRPLPQLSPSDIARFWKYVDKTPGQGPKGECWGWTAGTVRDYGYFSIKHVYYLAHRISYALHYGEDPLQLDICHSCDNPPCTNPAHLFKGTHQDNMADATAKDRWPSGEQHWTKYMPERINLENARAAHLRGEAVYNAKLTEDIVRQIRKVHKETNASGPVIGAQFGLPRQQVNHIISRRTWKHVK